MTLRGPADSSCQLSRQERLIWPLTRECGMPIKFKSQASHQLWWTWATLQPSRMDWLRTALRTLAMSCHHRWLVHAFKNSNSMDLAVRRIVLRRHSVGQAGQVCHARSLIKIRVFKDYRMCLFWASLDQMWYILRTRAWHHLLAASEEVGLHRCLSLSISKASTLSSNDSWSWLRIKVLWWKSKWSRTKHLLK